MTSWIVCAPWLTALLRWSSRPIPPATPLIAAMRSSHTAVGWLEILLPPGSAAAFADHSGFTYTLAPAYGLSTRAAAFADAFADAEAGWW